MSVSADNSTGGVLIAAPSHAAQRPALFEVTNTLSGALGTLNGDAVPQLAVAYVIVLGWLKLRRGELSIATELIHWTHR